MSTSRQSAGSPTVTAGVSTARDLVARAAVKRCRPVYSLLHTAVGGYFRPAYTEALDDEKAVTAVGFVFRARAFLAAHGITRIERIVTDNGACYKARDFAKVLLGARHQRIAPYTPRHNGKVERYNRIWPRNSSTPANGPQIPSATRRWESGTSTTPIIDHIQPPETGHQPAASPPASPTSWPHTTSFRDNTGDRMRSREDGCSITVIWKRCSGRLSTP
jgi:transposase InsO family protein